MYILFLKFKIKKSKITIENLLKVIYIIIFELKQYK